MNFVCQIDETMMGEDSMTLNLPRPKPPKKKDIQYGPAPKHLIEAVRKQLRILVELPDLDANLGRIGRFANQSDDMLMCVKDPVAVMRGEHEITVPGVADSAPGIEAYGSSVIRQLIPALTSYQKSQQESPQALVQAIADARRAGMDDVAAELEKKLLGKALPGERPVDLKPLKPFHPEPPLLARPNKPMKRRASAGVVVEHVNGTGQ